MTSSAAAKDFILASASPRRRELLASAGLCFDVQPSRVGEEPWRGEDPEHYVRRLAADKARQVAAEARARGDTRPVLAADTTVVLDGQPLGKPADVAEARWMLEALSDRAHQVITAFCVIGPSGAEELESVATEVRFKRLRPEEVDAYLASLEWQDKAGGYAIQGRAACLVRTITGSYTNVVGLPLCESVEALRRAGVRAGGAGP